MCFLLVLVIAACREPAAERRSQPQPQPQPQAQPQPQPQPSPQQPPPALTSARMDVDTWEVGREVTLTAAGRRAVEAAVTAAAPAPCDEILTRAFDLETLYVVARCRHGHPGATFQESFRQTGDLFLLAYDGPTLRVLGAVTGLAGGTELELRASGPLAPGPAVYADRQVRCVVTDTASEDGQHAGDAAHCAAKGTLARGGRVTTELPSEGSAVDVIRTFLAEVARARGEGKRFLVRPIAVVGLTCPSPAPAECVVAELTQVAPAMARQARTRIRSLDEDEVQAIMASEIAGMAGVTFHQVSVGLEDTDHEFEGELVFGIGANGTIEFVSAEMNFNDL